MTSRILLLHGFLGSPDSFRSLLERLPGLGEMALIPSLLGHGLATQNGSGHEFLAEVARLAAWLEQRVESPVDVLGYSMGGRLALSLAVEFPKLVRSLCLVSARRGLDDDQERALRRRADEDWARRFETEPLGSVLTDWNAQSVFRASVSNQESPSPSLSQSIALSHDPRGLAIALRRLGLAEMPSYRREVGQLQVPTTLLVGSLDQKFSRLAARLEQEIPGADRVVVEGRGHRLLDEAPEAVGRGFLRGIEK